MSRRVAARAPTYPAYPEVRSRIGENPARFLSDETDLDPRPRIYGIEDESVLDGWYEVELDLGPRRFLR